LPESIATQNITTVTIMMNVMGQFSIASIDSGATTFSITTFGIMTLIIIGLFVTLGIIDT
jgi:hypothetical protein